MFDVVIVLVDVEGDEGEILTVWSPSNGAVGDVVVGEGVDGDRVDGVDVGDVDGVDVGDVEGGGAKFSEVFVVVDIVAGGGGKGDVVVVGGGDDGAGLKAAAFKGEALSVGGEVV